MIFERDEIKVQTIQSQRLDTIDAENDLHLLATQKDGD